MCRGRVSFPGLVFLALMFGMLLSAACSRGGDEDGATQPPQVATNTPAPQAEAALGDDGRLRHVVVRGESLAGIADRYGVTVAELMEANYGFRDPPQSVIDFFERLHAGEGCMFAPGNVMVIPTGRVDPGAAGQ